MFTNFPDYAQFLADGYKIAPAPALERAEFDDGYIQQAPKTSLSRHEVLLTYRLPSLAYQEAFELWRSVDLRLGALYFAWTDPKYPTATVQRRARIVNGEVTYTALTDRFDDWTVSFTLEFWA